jgi:hypothetical protein
VTEFFKRAAEVMAPWQSLYGDSAVVSTIVLFLHLTGLVIAGGIAIATDWMTHRMDSDSSVRARHLSGMLTTHRVVVTALVVVFASGILMFTADIETFAPSRVFWLKMGLIAALLLNGWNMTRIEERLRSAGIGSTSAEELWSRLKGSATISAVLWISIVLAGTILTKI